MIEPTAEPDKTTRKSKPYLALLPVALFIGLVVLFAFALGKGDPSKLPSALIGKPAPELTLPALANVTDNGKPIPGWTTAELRNGDVTIVNFFASWCAPCVQEHPYLVALGKETGLRILGVNHKDPAPGGKRFLERYGNPYAAVGADPEGRVAIEWGVYGMPETFIVDGSGRIAAKHVGPITRQILDSVILPAISNAKATPAGNLSATPASPSPMR